MATIPTPTALPVPTQRVKYVVHDACGICNEPNVAVVTQDKVTLTGCDCPMPGMHKSGKKGVMFAKAGTVTYGEWLRYAESEGTRVYGQSAIRYIKSGVR